MQSGLPVEDLNKFVTEGGVPAVKRIAEKFLSQTHPLITAGVEMMTDKQLFSGRPMDQLHSFTKEMTGTKRPWLDKAIHYSPWARDITGIEKWTDERTGLGIKALNYTTGARIKTIDVGLAKQRDLEKAFKEDLKANPDIRTLEDPFITKARRAELEQTPEGQAKLAELQRKLKTTRGIRAAINKMTAETKAREAIVNGPAIQ
jgi:hypothetical protein